MSEKNSRNVCRYKKNAYLCTRLTATKVDSLAQQVEHIPFKDGVLGSSPRRITETRKAVLSSFFNLQQGRGPRVHNL